MGRTLRHVRRQTVTRHHEIPIWKRTSHSITRYAHTHWPDERVLTNKEGGREKSIIRNRYFEWPHASFDSPRIIETTSSIDRFPPIRMDLENDVSIPLFPTRSGHISLLWNYVSVDRIEGPASPDVIYQVEEETYLTIAQLKKLHEQFGYASISTLSRLLELSKTPYREGELSAVVTDCTCRMPNCAPQNPIVSR